MRGCPWVTLGVFCNFVVSHVGLRYIDCNILDHFTIIIYGQVSTAESSLWGTNEPCQEVRSNATTEIIDPSTLLDRLLLEQVIAHEGVVHNVESKMSMIKQNR